MTEAFDPASHRVGPSRYFEDFAIGEAFYIPSRTVTEAQFLAFQAASGDNHPIHYDREFCRRHGHRDLLAHGYQVLIQTAAGAGQFPFLVEDSLSGVHRAVLALPEAGLCRRHPLSAPDGERAETPAHHRRADAGLHGAQPEG